MSYEIRTCPRCKEKHECKPANMVHCECSGINISAELADRIAEEFVGCICRSCLEELSQRN